DVRPERLDDWIKNNQPLAERVARLAAPYNLTRQRRKQAQRTVLPRFVLLHTLAHLLINQLSFDCGYGSSSLRERIYCTQEHDQPMMGLLLYTASGDAEGTLGGLVRQGS